MLYILFYIFLISLVYFYDFRNKVIYKEKYLNFLLVFFISLGGFRYYVGADTFDYVIEFDDYPTLNDFSLSLTKEQFRYQTGWIFFMVICKTIVNSFILPQLIVSTIFNAGLFRLIKKYSAKPFTTILFYFSAQVFTGLNFEFMREAFAVGIFLFAYSYFEKSNWVKYYVLVFLAFLIHVSAFFCFLLPLFKFIKFNNKSLFLFISITFFIVLAFGKSLISQSLSLFVFSDSLNSIANGYGNGALRDTKSIKYLFYTFSTYLIFPLIIFFYSVNKKKYNLKFKNLLIAYFTVSVLSSLSADFIRFNHYLFIFLLIEISHCFYLIFIRLQPKLLILLVFPLIFNFTNMHFLFFNYISNNGLEHTYNRYIPYNSVIDRGFSDFRKDYYRNFNKSKNNFNEY